MATIMKGPFHEQEQDSPGVGFMKKTARASKPRTDVFFISRTPLTLKVYIWLRFQIRGDTGDQEIK